MKILHTSDWHLGKRLDNFSRLGEQQAVMDEIIDIAYKHKVDAVLIAGDLFDTYNPASDAVELFYKTLKRLSAEGRRAVIAIAGNHDSPDRIEAPDPLARENGIIFLGYPTSEVPQFKLATGLKVMNSETGFIELQLPYEESPLRLILTPYANEFRLKTFLGKDDEDQQMRDLLQARWKNLANRYCDEKGVNLLVTHLFVIDKEGDVPKEPEDEKPILHVGGAQAIYLENIPKQIQYAALGHLHQYQMAGNQNFPAVYCGSPLSYSFSEAGQNKYVTVIEAYPGKPAHFEKVMLNAGKKLLRKRFENIDEAVSWLSENPETLVELTLVADNYLTAADRKRLHQAQKGIITIIPEIRNKENQQKQQKQIDPGENMEVLFKQYFKHQHQQEPNTDLINLFKEINAEKSGE